MGCGNDSVRKTLATQLRDWNDNPRTHVKLGGVVCICHPVAPVLRSEAGEVSEAHAPAVLLYTVVTNEETLS